MILIHGQRRTLSSILLSSVLVLGTLFGIGLALTTSITLANVARAETEEESMQKKTEWQERYRRLLQDQARLEKNAANARDNYARAQRRNYPRGDARAQFLVDADDAEKALVKVRAELAEIPTQARNEGVPPGWLSAVEEEPMAIPEPPAASATASDQDEPDDGRNPLYREDEDSK